ncbi:MAG: hypothetical protein ACK5AZ_20560 [Bryobacteraceae bacterium]
MPNQTNNTPNKRGPKTPEGRQRSSQNAIRHGLTAEQVVMPYESLSDFDALEAAVTDELQPETEIERQLVSDLVNYRWRLDRIVRIETATFDLKIGHQQRWVEREYPEADADIRLALAFENLADGPALKLLDRYEARFRRAYDRTLRTLLQLQAERRAREAAEQCVEESKTSAAPDPRPALVPQKLPNEFPPAPPAPPVNGHSSPAASQPEPPSPLNDTPPTPEM